MFDVVALPSRWPVEVNYHEAKAYCAWQGPHLRLLAEAEYHALCSTSASVTFMLLFCFTLARPACLQRELYVLLTFLLFLYIRPQ